MKTRLLVLVLCLGAIAVEYSPSVSGQADVEANAYKSIVHSTFDNGNEGWRASESRVSYPTTWDRRTRSIFFQAQGQTHNWAWVAPSKFTGDLSSAYAGLLYFTLVEMVNSSHKKTDDDVVLVGAGFGSHPEDFIFAHRIASETYPGERPVTYRIPLDEEWWYDIRTNQPPTRRQFVCALAHVKQLAIRGRYRNGTPHVGRLDSVAVGKRKSFKPDADYEPSAGSTIDFGLVPTATSHTKDLVILNNGTAPLALSGIKLKPNTSTFAVLAADPNNYCGIVAPGYGEKLTIRYIPPTVGRHKATLLIDTNETQANGRPKPPVRFKLVGQARGDLIKSDLDPVVFDKVGCYGANGSYQCGYARIDDVPIRNLSDRVLENVTFRFPEGTPFSISSISRIGPHAVYPVYAEYTPHSPGPHAATAEIFSGDAQVGTVRVQGHASLDASRKR